MKKLIILLIIIGILCTGCSGLSGKPTVCNGHPESIICKYIKDPKVADIAIRLINITAIKNDAYKADEAEKVLNKIRDFINAVNTYKDIADYIVRNVDRVNDKIGAEYFIISDYLILFDQPVEIQPYDIHLLTSHIDNLLGDLKSISV